MRSATRLSCSRQLFLGFLQVGLGLLHLGLGFLHGFAWVLARLHLFARFPEFLSRLGQIPACLLGTQSGQLAGLILQFFPELLLLLGEFLQLVGPLFRIRNLAGIRDLLLQLLHFPGKFVHLLLGLLLFLAEPVEFLVTLLLFESAEHVFEGLDDFLLLLFRLPTPGIVLERITDLAYLVGKIGLLGDLERLRPLSWRCRFPPGCP